MKILPGKAITVGFPGCLEMKLLNIGKRTNKLLILLMDVPHSGSMAFPDNDGKLPSLKPGRLDTPKVERKWQHSVAAF